MTLPHELRDALDLEEGDIVEFEVIGVVKKGKPAYTRAGPAGPSRPEGGRQ